MTNKTGSRLLMKEQPIVTDRGLAVLIGLNEAMVLQQIEYWLEINRKAKINLYDGYTWSFNTIDEWHKEFPFWSHDTVKRTLKKLRDIGVLIVGNYNKRKSDRTLWYRIDYNRLDELDECNSAKCTNEELQHIEDNKSTETLKTDNSAKCTNPLGQNALIHQGNLHPALPETTKETTKEISITTQSVENLPVADTNKELIENKTHLLLDSSNKRNKVSKWNKDRLVKAIDIFTDRQGQYFSLLEKIYADDKNFVNYNNSKATNNNPRTRYHNINQRTDKYEPNELDRLILDKQNDKNITTEKEIKSIKKTDNCNGGSGIILNFLHHME